MRKWPRASLIRYFTFANSEALLVTSLAAHKEILVDKCYSFEKPTFFVRLIADIVGLGLVFATGETHKKQRKVLRGTVTSQYGAKGVLMFFFLGLFSITNLKALIPVFQSKSQQLTSVFDEAIETQNGEMERKQYPSIVGRAFLTILYSGVNIF
jgi:hypothetical protein